MLSSQKALPGFIAFDCRPSSVISSRSTHGSARCSAMFRANSNAGGRTVVGRQDMLRNVRGVLEHYPHASIHDDTWARVTPASSLVAHLVLCGVRDLAERGEVPRTVYDASIWAVREAFFRDGRNIGEMPVLFDILATQGVSASRVEERIRVGKRSRSSLATTSSFASTTSS